MKKACPCLAGFAALAVALTVAAAPADPNPAKDKAKDAKVPVEKAPPRDLNSPYANTAIGAVVDANDGKVPATGTELVAALAKLGDFVQLPIPFSAVALNSGLTHPRVVITMRPSTTPPPKEVFIPDNKPAPNKQAPPSIGGWGWSGPSGSIKLIPQPPEPLNQISVNRTQLQGRLFLAANTENTDGPVKVRTVEFISWNSHKLKFEFGVIEGMGTDTPELKFLDGARCVSCHKNRGPILGADPWSNTLHNTVVQKTATELLNQPRKRADGTTAGVFNADGVHFTDPHAPEVDAAVRIGGDLVRDRALFKRLAETPDGRRALLIMFDAILTKGSLEKNDKASHGNLNALPLARFVRDALNAKQNAAPSLLRDFSPAGPVVKEIVGVGPGGKVKNQVAKYDDLRALGQARLPSEYLPSNPKAFVAPQVKAVQQTSEIYNAVLLAQTIGLTEKDRDFLSSALDEAEKRLKNPALTRATIANMVLTGPAFADLMTTGNLPDRDDFKDRFVAGIVAVFKSQGRTDDFWAARDTYASTPKFDPNARLEKEVAILPSHACLACHDVLGASKTAFNPIPALHFDPFDATARAEWLKNADRTTKAEVLGRLLKRLGTDKDMPPADSTEAAMYHTKDPAGLNAVKNWLEAELKKAK